MKRCRYYVPMHKGDVARFSEPVDAMRHAFSASRHYPSHLFEVVAPDGVIGQFRSGQSTPEFQAVFEDWKSLLILPGEESRP